MTINRSDVKVVSDDIRMILSETISDYEKRAGKELQPAHIEHSILQSYAYRELLVRKGINEAFLQTFPQFATGLMLDLLGEMMNVDRFKQTKAICTLRFAIEEAHENVIIPKNTIVAVSDSVLFETDSDAIILSTEQYVDITAYCKTPGEIGNGWQVGQIATIKSEIDQRVTASNVSESAGGIDIETDDSYRQRILLAPESFTTCGSVAAYDFHARAVSPDIVDVDVSSPVAGTVRIIVLTKKGKPSDELLETVYESLSAEEKRPLCDVVEVSGPNLIEYQVNAKLTLLNNVDSKHVLNAAEKSLKYYLSGRSQKLGVDIVPLEIASKLKVHGVYNVELLELPLMKVARDYFTVCTNINLMLDDIREDG